MNKFRFLTVVIMLISAIGYAGDPNVRTPNIDRLAKESYNFRNAVSVCPVCTPYRASPEELYWDGYDVYAQTIDAQQYITDQAELREDTILVFTSDYGEMLG